MQRKVRIYTTVLSYFLMLVIFFFFAIRISEDIYNFTDSFFLSEGYSVKHVIINDSKNSKNPIIEEYKNKSIITLPIYTIRNELMQDKWVSKAQVKRVLPDTIEVSILNHKPIALLNSHSIIADDLRTLITMDTIDSKKQEIKDLLRINCTEEAKAIAFLKIVLNKLGKTGVSKIAEMTDISGRRWNITFKNGANVKLSANEQEDSLEKLKRILSKNPSLSNIKTLDLRLPDRMFSR